jgi:hypothetical protein
MLALPNRIFACIGMLPLEIARRKFAQHYRYRSYYNLHQKMNQQASLLQFRLATFIFSCH